MKPKMTTPQKKETTDKDTKEHKEKEVKVEKSAEEIIDEKNKVDTFRVKVRITVDYIKLKYF